MVTLSVASESMAPVIAYLRNFIFPSFIWNFSISRFCTRYFVIQCKILVCSINAHNKHYYLQEIRQ